MDVKICHCLVVQTNKNMKLLIITTFLLGTTFAFPKKVLPLGEKSAALLNVIEPSFDQLTPRQKIETINDFVDVAMTELGFLIIDIGMDPMALPKINESFNVIGQKGNIRLDNGELHDLSTISRNGDVEITYDNETRVLISAVPLRFEQFRFNYDFGLTALGANTDGTVEGSVTDIPIFIKLEVNFKDLVLVLHNADVPDIKSLKVEFKGLGSLQWLGNILAGLVSGLFKGIIKNILVTIVAGTLTKIVEKINEALAGLK